MFGRVAAVKLGILVDIYMLLLLWLLLLKVLQRVLRPVGCQSVEARAVHVI